MVGYNDERDRLERKLRQFLLLAHEFLPLILSLSKDGLNQTQLGKTPGRSLLLILSLSKDVSNHERRSGGWICRI